MKFYPSSFQAQIDACVTKQDQANLLKNAFGNTPRLRGFRDANASATDPATTGVEFLNIGISGAPTIVAGNITKFGTLTGTTKSLGVDLSTGVAVLRFEGNGNIMELSFGLVGSGREKTVPYNPTAGCGYAFVDGIKSNKLLDSGTGYLSPPDPVYALETEDWSSGQAGASTITPIDKRLINYVNDDPELQANRGDVRTMITSVANSLGDMLFGAMLWAMNGSTNSQGSEPLVSVIVTSMPKPANWPRYPRKAGYINGTSNTFAPPHKHYLRKNGARIYTFQMRDALPMNDPSLNQGGNYNRDLLATNPVRPFVCCAQVLPYRSARPKMSSFAQKYYPGQQQNILRPTVGRRRFSSNPAIPFIDGRNQGNGRNSFFAAPKWAVLASPAGFAADVNNDPYIWDYKTGSEKGYGNMLGGEPLQTGYGWEPGSPQWHDNYPGPGGARPIDRGAINAPTAIYMTLPTYKRPKGGEAILDLVEEHNKGYCNIPRYFIADVTTGATIPIEEVLAGMWANGGGSYYGGNPSYVPGGTEYTIDLFSIGNGSGSDYSKPFTGAFLDKNGRPPFNCGELDDLHSYKTSFYAALLFNDPMYDYLVKHDVIGNILARLEQRAPTANPRGYFLTRANAWRELTYLIGWKLSSDHPWGIPRASVVKAAVLELETAYDNILVPYLAGSQDTYCKALRNFGVPLRKDPGYWEMGSNSLMYYMAGVMQMQVSTGYLDMICAQSKKCRDFIAFRLRCMDMYACDWMYGTRGVNDWYEDSIFIGPRGPDVIDLQPNWDAVGVARNDPAAANWVTNADGSFHGEQDGSQHLRYQYLCFRRDWAKADKFPWGGNHPLLDTIAVYKGYYDKVQANVNSLVAANADKETIRSNEFFAQQPMYGEILPPQA